MEPNTSWVIEKCADSHYILGHFEESLALWNKILALNEVLFLCKRGECYYFLQQYEEALKDFTVAIQNEPKNGKIYGWRGECYRMIGNFPLALLDIEKSLKLDQTDTMALRARADIRRQNKDFIGAIKDATRAIPLEADSEFVFIVRVQCLMTTRQYSAYHDLKTLETLNPDCEIEGLTIEELLGEVEAYFEDDLAFCQ